LAKHRYMYRDSNITTRQNFKLKQRKIQTLALFLSILKFLVTKNQK